MRAAEAMLAAAALDPSRRDALSKVLFRVANPARAASVMSYVAGGDIPDAIDTLTPSEMYVVAGEMTAGSDKTAGPVTAEIIHVRSLAGEQVGDAAISRAWGTPKPTLANSYRPELLNLRTFPTLMGYSSRIMAESWESNMLYWADVSDQMGVAPTQLNVLVPEWTEKVVERIFASHLEDWPALLRSVRSVGEELRKDNPQGVVNSARAGN